MIAAAKRHSRLIPALLAIIVIAAVGPGICHGSQPVGYDANLIKAVYTAADHLEKHLVSELNRVMPILSTGFVNLENPKGTSAFGRLLGEQVASRFSQHGYRVIDMAMPKQSPFAKEKTTPALQDTKGITAPYELQAAIVGDYIVSDDLAYVSVRIVKIPDNSILTSCDFSIRLNETLKEMANRIALPDEPLVQKPIKTKLADATGGESSNKHPGQEILDTKIDKKPVEKSIEKPQNGPFATGTIVLNPNNRLAAKLIQARLAELGFYRDRIDGIWKGHSREALKEFKETRGLSYTVRWDMNTQKALFQGTGQ
jgi:hypothetical protein